MRSGICYAATRPLVGRSKVQHPAAWRNAGSTGRYDEVLGVTRDCNGLTFHTHNMGDVEALLAPVHDALLIEAGISAMIGAGLSAHIGGTRRR